MWLLHLQLGTMTPCCLATLIPFIKLEPGKGWRGDQRWPFLLPAGWTPYTLTLEHGFLLSRIGTVGQKGSSTWLQALCSDSPDNPLPHTAWHSGLSLEKGLAASWLRSVAGARGSGGGGVVCCSAIWSVRECSDAVNPGCPLGLIAFRADAFPPLGPVGQVTQCQVLSLFPSMVLLFIISVSAAQVLGTSTAPAPRQSLGSLGLFSSATQT